MKRFFLSKQFIFLNLPEEAEKKPGSAQEAKKVSEFKFPEFHTESSEALELWRKQFLENNAFVQEHPKGQALKISGDNPQENFRINFESQSLEQKFTFGDENVPLKVTFPKPSAGKNIQIIYHITDDIERTDQAKIWNDLKQKQEELGSVILVSISTPKGKVNINKKEVNLLEGITKSLERYPGFNKEKIKNIVSLMETGEKQNVIKMVTDYHNLDPRMRGVLPVEKGNYLEAINEFLKNTPVNSNEKMENRGAKQNEADKLRGNSTYHIGRPHAPPVLSSSQQVTFGEQSDTIGTKAADVQSNPTISPLPDKDKDHEIHQETENKGKILENDPSLDNKVLFLGDSLMEGIVNTKDNRQMREKLNLAEKGKFTKSMLSEMARLDENGKLKEYQGWTLVMNGGVNDIIGGISPENTFSNLEKIWSLAEKNGIKISCCTIGPFKGYLKTKNFEEKNENRKKLNELIMQQEGLSGGPNKVTKLHLGRSQGGMADDNDLDHLHPDFGSIDGLHPAVMANVGKGYNLMASLLKS